MALIGLTVLACSPGEPDSAPDTVETQPAKGGSAALSVFTVNYPLQYFAERLGGELVEVSFPAPAEEDPAYWAPGPEVVAEYQRADLILLNGVGYAKWLERATLPAGKLVDTSAGFQDRWIALDEGPVHTHGPEGEHSHKGYAFTTWLDLTLAVQQAEAIATAMSRKRPHLRGTFQSNFKALARDLKILDQDIQMIVSKKPSKPLIVSHPVYDYFTRRYGLNIASLHWEPDEFPDEGQWIELQKILNDHPAKWMIWEGEPIPKTVEKLKNFGIESLVFDPCGNVPKRGDFLTIMRQNAKNLQSAFGKIKN